VHVYVDDLGRAHRSAQRRRVQPPRRSAAVDATSHLCAELAA
jgi:hypothetical protein